MTSLKRISHESNNTNDIPPFSARVVSFTIICIYTMTGEADTENQATMNEQTPLLQDHQSDQQKPDEPDKNRPGPKKVSWYIWRAFWTIAASLVLSIFIKGWIDAGSDVNVSTTPRYRLFSD
jgi:hypothetical protein